MESPLRCVLALILLTAATDLVFSQEITASENPLPIGKNITLSLSSQTPIIVGTWLHKTDVIVVVYPGGSTTGPAWLNRITFNSTSGELSIRSLQLADSGLYTFEGLDPILRAQITLSVQEPISNVTLRVNETNLVEFNDTAVFVCSVSNGSSLSYRWLNGSSEVTASEGVQFGDGGSTLTIVGVTRYDQGPFKCNVSNGISDEISRPVHLTISYGPERAMIMGPSVSLTGQHVMFNCSASSRPPSHFSWFHNGSLVGNTSEYTTGPLTLHMTGKYICMAYNNITGRNSVAYKMLTVLAPVTSVRIVGGQPIQNYNFTLTCETTGSVTSIYWMKDGWQLHADNRTILSMDNASLTFDPVLTSDNGYYQCHASNQFSNLPSSNFTLKVNYGPEKPTIRGPGLAMTGQSVTLNCSASSHPPCHYSWFFNGSLVANTSVFETGPLALNMSGKYMCMAYNNITGRNSTAYKMLIVVDPIIYIGIEMPSNHAIAGHSYMLTCNVTGPADYVYWMKNSGPLYADNQTIFSMDNKTVMFSPVTKNDSGYYQCKGVNAVSNMTSLPYVLLVYYGPGEPIITGPSIAETGEDVAFSCFAPSMPPSHYSWFFNGSLVANTSVFQTGPLTLNMSGKYMCMAYNNVTGRNSTAYKMLIVVDPIIYIGIEMPSNHAIAGHSYMLTCNVTGPADYVYWMKNSGPLYADNQTIFSMDNKTVMFSPVTKNDSGYYQCKGVNAVSNMTSLPYVLLVYYGPGEPIITGPSIAETGEDVAFSCFAPSMPPSHYSWFFNGSLVANTSVFQTGPLTLNMSGEYTCMAYNVVTEKNSTNSTTLTVIEGIKSVMVKPDTVPIDFNNLTLTCEVNGSYDSIYWMKDGMRLTTVNSTLNSNMSYYIGNNSLHFSPVTVYNDGTYQCVAIGVLTHISPDYMLLVNYGPLSVEITGPDSVELGSVLTVSLTCSADSQPTSEYYWFFNHQPSVVETGSIVTIWATEWNAGNYTCKATNPVTNITMSRTKELTITGHASALLLQSQRLLMLMALVALSLPVMNDWLDR
ncbi:carcinoembryonic antigen-related cell adhesion molecule 1 [Polymixia lowei]